MDNKQTVLNLLELKNTLAGYCPVAYLKSKELKRCFNCTSCCGVCARPDHLRKDCPNQIQGNFCYFCYLPQSMCNEQLHHPEEEYGKNACPWKNITIALMVLARQKDALVIAELGNVDQGPDRHTREQRILLKLWAVPQQGDLLPLGVRLLLKLAARR
jgi:hypothetical protein